MIVKFQLEGVDLQQSEAETLLATGGNDSSIKIELRPFIKKDMVCSQTLFEMSVKENRPELAQLAAKLAFGKKSESKKDKPLKAVKARAPRQRITRVDVKELTLDEGIEKFSSVKTSATAGAAAILSVLSRTNNLTVREIATQIANEMWIDGMNLSSSVFKGFKSCPDTGLLAPDVQKPEKGKVVFHNSPLYNSLRQGSILLIESGFVEGKEEVSMGSEFKTLEGSQALLRRTVYRLSLTGRGGVLTDTWADVKTFVTNYWKEKSF